MAATARSFADVLPFQNDFAVTAQLLQELAPKVKATVRAVLGAAHPDVDDAVQQALIALARALPAYRGECEVVGYARVIATRVAIGMRRRGRAAASRHDDGAEPDLIAEGRPSPAETVGAGERKAIIRELLDEMPEAQAETLALRIVLGLSLEEVAVHTGVPVNTVRSRLRLAKERLKQRIEADPMLMEALER
jgi:RNA polymerase sigma factor (sigma-70 family)